MNDTDKIPVGAKVTFLMTGKPIVGRVLEDRGPIGVGGRRLYLVRYELDKGNWYSIELPAVDIESVEYHPVDLRKKRAVEYIFPVETPEGPAVTVKPAHVQPLAIFLRSQDVRFTQEPADFPGEVFFLIDKNTPWEGVR